MAKLLFIALGGAIGSVLRYTLSGWVQHGTDWRFPAGTLAVNVLGCFVLGFLAAATSGSGPWLLREEHKFGLTIGILGGFTTFSTFGLETFHLVNDGQYRLAAANVVLSCLLGFVGVWLGFRLAERWLGV